MSQLATKNAHGVYMDREVIALPNLKRGWQGSALAEIRVAFTPDGWRSAIGFNFTTGSWWGHAEPITDRNTVFSSRDEAIANAAQRLRSYIEPGKLGSEWDAMATQQRAILAWLDELQPAQGDLLALL